MASLAFFEPLQAFATLGAAMNFGGSALQSPLIMPMLQEKVVDVPLHYSSRQVAYLLHDSEKFFPPLNALCTLSNLILAGTAYYNRNSPIMAIKWPRLAIAFGLNMATTVYALAIMVPNNVKMTKLSKEMNEAVAKGDAGEPANKQKEMQFRQIQQKWMRLNLGRAACMLGAAVAGISALMV